MSAEPPNLLTVVIPARDEEACIASTVKHLNLELRLQQVPHEIIVVDDGSSDRHLGGSRIAQRAHAGAKANSERRALRLRKSHRSRPRRHARRTLQLGYDCVFGSRFIKGGGVIDYPPFKLFLNRMVNRGLRFLFHIKLNDSTTSSKRTGAK